MYIYICICIHRDVRRYVGGCCRSSVIYIYTHGFSVQGLGPIYMYIYIYIYTRFRLWVCVSSFGLSAEHPAPNCEITISLKKSWSNSCLLVTESVARQILLGC